MQALSVPGQEPEGRGLEPWAAGSPGVTPAPQTNLQRLMSSAEEACRDLAFSLALRAIQNSPR